MNVIAKRRIPEAGSSDDNSDPMFMYYVNDGVYGSFNCLLFDHADVTVTLPQPKVRKKDVAVEAVKLKFHEFN